MRTLLRAHTSFSEIPRLKCIQKCANLSKAAAERKGRNHGKIKRERESELEKYGEMDREGEAKR